jgi:glucan phosphoethanolaminetransferase (alkaline phosphatase superfamily)
VPARSETLREAARREFAVNAAPALQLGLGALLPFLPFLLWSAEDGFAPASKAAFFIAGGLVLVALLARWAYFAFALFFVPLSVLSIHLVLRFGGDGAGWKLDQPDARVETYFESPDRETLEYFQTQWWRSDTAMLVLGLVYLVLLAWLFRSRRGLTTPARGAVAIVLAAWLAVAAATGIRANLADWPQFQLAAAAVEAERRLDRLAERDEAVERAALPTADCTQRYRKVVVVLGESVALRHLQAFGYPRATTPFAVRSHPQLFEALAPANQTRISLAMMLTAVGSEDFDDFYETPSLVSRLRNCGYRTLWISNQGRVGRHDSPASSIAHEADEAVFLNDLSYKEARLDGDVVGALAERGAFAATRQATFIHLIGSHMRYAARVPRGFGFPRVSGTVDDYDNSILYTDTLLAELYKRFGREGLLLIYAPDHGEVVSSRVFGHGFSPGYQDEYLVPLMIWTDDAAATVKLRAALGGRRLNLESFDDVVSYLVGSTDALHVSTRTLVSNLTARNAVPFESLARFGASKPRK